TSASAAKPWTWTWHGPRTFPATAPTPPGADAVSGAGGITTAGRDTATGDIPVDTPRLPAREAAESELSKPMYHENDPNFLQRALNRFWDWVAGVFDAAAGATPGGPA